MTAKLRGLPPGRAGRVWLRRRLIVAARGADLLERKLRILVGEEQSFALLAERTKTEWDDAARELERWTLRGSLLSGERGLRMSGDSAMAEVEVAWRLTMGVRYPADGSCHLPRRAATRAVPDNTALVHAVVAAERAVRAGVDHAVAVAALAAMRAEIVSTRRQLRAVRDRWTPRLEAAHRAVTIALDDQEHDEGVRLRWAADPTRRRAIR
ncbi:MAG: V-type ATP synthase subunit D [Dermatophilaceae bacterium]